jgi:hypothetical protein
VISGLDTTATVTVPVLPLLPLAPPLEEPPPLEHAAAAVTATAAQAAATSLRFLNLVMYVNLRYAHLSGSLLRCACHHSELAARQCQEKLQL